MTLQDMIEEILKVIDFNARNRAQNDVERTNHCAGIASGEAKAFRFLGIEYDFGTWQDGDYEMVGYFYVDGVVLVESGKINWKAYADAVLDKTHAWGMRELAVR